MDRPDRLVHALQPERPRIRVADAVDLRRQVDDGLRCERLAGSRLPAQASRQVERRTAIATLDRDRLAGVEADPDAAGQLGREPDLELERGPQGPPGEDEDGKRLIAAELEEEAIVEGHDLADDGREPAGELRRGIRSVLGRIGRVAADVGDEERPKLGLCFGPRVRPGVGLGLGDRERHRRLRLLASRRRDLIGVRAGPVRHPLLLHRLSSVSVACQPQDPQLITLPSDKRPRGRGRGTASGTSEARSRRGRGPARPEPWWTQPSPPRARWRPRAGQAAGLLVVGHDGAKSPRTVNRGIGSRGPAPATAMAGPGSRSAPRRAASSRRR